ncbi:hypothetical protein JFU37_03560 [Pseudomonas sp. TH41]|uniref:hypothetical protein n=1 Tax=Pseudomonas sp. TH41 TaxID=2796405 RepID=UPI0019120052|nr:hypothetical protein [Pseudomonas sp. TH41]MBK5351602.1 hypothetical protein [Pseudomonas sp. TH41]
MLALLLITAGGVWKVQDWRYGKQLAEQVGTHQADLTAISNAAAAQVRADQDKRIPAERSPNIGFVHTGQCECRKPTFLG